MNGPRIPMDRADAHTLGIPVHTATPRPSDHPPQRKVTAPERPGSGEATHTATELLERLATTTEADIAAMPDQDITALASMYMLRDLVETVADDMELDCQWDNWRTEAIRRALVIAHNRGRADVQQQTGREIDRLDKALQVCEHTLHRVQPTDAEIHAAQRASGAYASDWQPGEVSDDLAGFTYAHEIAARPGSGEATRTAISERLHRAGHPEPIGSHTSGPETPPSTTTAGARGVKAAARGVKVDIWRTAMPWCDCPNQPPCGHFWHDIYELGDPYPTCCEEGCRCGHPGEATLQRHDDATVTVVHADPVIRVSRDLLESGLIPEHYDPQAEVLILDTAGEWRYRYLRPDPSDSRVLIFGRERPGSAPQEER